MSDANNTANDGLDRRRFLSRGAWAVGALGVGGLGLGLAAGRAQERQYVWQLDPDKCISCGNCQTHCVLDESAVKAVQCFQLCGFCDICTGYFPTDQFELDTAAENHLCPTNAIRRRFVEEQAGVRYFEYTVDESLCVGCGKCVKGCALMNGSLYLQVRHDRCLNCNECAIAVACPADAYRRVPADEPTILKEVARKAIEGARKAEGTAEGDGHEA
jgi:Na+-translocating ferredoxin:NAD+ oxidoreductase subunit B